MIKRLKFAIVSRSLNRKKLKSSIVFKPPVKNVILVLDSSNIEALPILLQIKDALNLKESNFNVVLFKNKSENFPHFNGLTFVEKDLNFFGKFTNKELLNFSQKNIDLLITFAEGNNVVTNLFTASCNAALKIGKDLKNEKFFDVIIRCGNDVEVFTSEVIKFLKQFKNVKNE